jgi:hypothetical protein
VTSHGRAALASRPTPALPGRLDHFAMARVSSQPILPLDALTFLGARSTRLGRHFLWRLLGGVFALTSFSTRPLSPRRWCPAHRRRRSVGLPAAPSFSGFCDTLPPPPSTRRLPNATLCARARCSFSLGARGRRAIDTTPRVVCAPAHPPCTGGHLSRNYRHETSFESRISSASPILPTSPRFVFFTIFDL